MDKLYNCNEFQELEQQVHEFAWIDLQAYYRPDSYILTSIGFGDGFSGFVAVLALRYAMELSVGKFSEASYMIVADASVNDIVHSAKSEGGILALVDVVEGVLSNSSFGIKGWVLAGYQESRCPTEW